MANWKIPFNRASLVGGEFDNVRAAIEGGHISGDGPFTRQCHDFFVKALGVGRALLTTSCTHALEMAALLLNLGPNDEVIVPSFTFVSTANAFALRGARPVFVDIRPDTLNLDERLLERKVTPRTRAIVVVHYAGIGCEMDAILAIASRHGIPVIEDNAHGLFGQYRGRNLGTFGCLATLSFHETKNLTCGEGGALLINDEQYIERAEIIREKGTNRSLFFRGGVEKYSWVDLGSSYLPSEILAAFLFAQLNAKDQIQAQRKHAWSVYDLQLRSWARETGCRLPIVPEYCTQPYHMFYILTPSLEWRTSFIAYLKRASIMAVFHYLPLHLSAMGKKWEGRIGDCPVTEDISDRLVRLPFFSAITMDELRQVIEVVCKFQGP